MAGRQQVHSRIQRKLERGKVRDIRIPCNLRAPMLTVPDFAGVVVGAVRIVQAGRGHHAAIVQFGHGWIPASMRRRSYINERLAGRIENRSIGQARKWNVALGTHNGQSSVTFRTAIDQDSAILHDRHSIAEHVPGRRHRH